MSEGPNLTRENELRVGEPRKETTMKKSLEKTMQEELVNIQWLTDSGADREIAATELQYFDKVLCHIVKVFHFVVVGITVTESRS